MMHEKDDGDADSHWSAVQRLPSMKRLRTSLFDCNENEDGEQQKGKRMVDVTKLSAVERRLFIKRLIKHTENDNLQLLQKQKERTDRVNVKLPSIEVRYNNLCVEAECEVVKGNPLPTLWNATKSFLLGIAKIPGLASETKINIIKDVSGIIKPSRMTLLLGPPGCGKTTFLLALAGKLDKSFKLAGEISYNGFKLEEFAPGKSSAYISQNDMHIPEMTVREILDFSARFQGVGSRAEIMKEVSRREKLAGIVPEPDIDIYMKAISVEGLERSLQTDYVLKIMGLEICAEITVGDEMRRGVSGGQKKRLTTGEMIVGPTKVLFMDDISTGLDSSTTYQIVKCLQQMAHIMEVTMVISLLQPAPETYELFDDIILMAKGQIAYHGPRCEILSFFEVCGFKCPERKGEADFLQELTITGIITMSFFMRTRPSFDVQQANFYMASLFYAITFLMINGLPEMAFTIARLSGFYKQRDLHFYPAWAYAIPASILKIPLSLIESLVWTLLTYYVTGYSPEAKRFFGQFLILFLVHQMAVSLSRFIGAYFQTLVSSVLVASLALMVFTLCGGFLIPKSSMPVWFKWAFWVSPITYSEIALSVNEFLAPRWQRSSSGNMTIGIQVLSSHALNYSYSFYWISVGALIGYIILFNVAFTLALTFTRSIGKSRAIISHDKLSQMKQGDKPDGATVQREDNQRGKMVLPVQPLTVTFQDLQYYVDTPPELREQGYTGKKLQLLNNITGAFRPSILSALMGVSGAGKTTLLDVLSGRKTSGTIAGDIRIGGYPKTQETFTRISGYCEQTDIHSPQITVRESVIYSAWLRLPQEIDSEAFVNEVLQTIELDGIKDELVGVPGEYGLSTEQRKRLTIAVELVSNPSIIFMDEPTSGLDARSAAVVMRAVKNIAETGRTVVCTIHQPSIHIFEAFDELILMKAGGELIYSGPIGENSSEVIKYFEGILGVPKITDKYNPATWMLEVTSTSNETQLGVDFAEIYRESTLYKENAELVKELSKPPPGSTELHFTTRFPRNNWEQCKACLWKQHLSYWRSPSYNLVRITFVFISALILAVLFWKHGKVFNTEQDLFNLLGSLYMSVVLTGVNSCTSVIPYIITERTVFYREKFAGMYSTVAYSLAQVLIEIPYVIILALMFTIITYPTIGYFWSPYKFIWFFYTISCAILSYVYLGMLLVSLTPNFQIASIFSSFLFQTLNLFSGFLIPGPGIPKWWKWAYYIMPTSWILKGVFTSQYGDIKQEVKVFGETKTVAAFLEDFYGFHQNSLTIVAFVLISFPVLFASLFMYFIGKLDFQKR
ncbi:P-loop containing nucleoside triphosphate hydrolase protein [Dioscorea alata]|uniref:P-loop containing nucleoside triphosphate hydrolase protein n=1 Tax=Dioscorea alata TaxID=55571 RepID=A0ACB7U4M5_DIOAL|nr:P-loop containing nucleoside triphosphate hydrolase protein [Dioscorea alata]